MSCRGESAEVPADELGGTSLREEKAYLDCKTSKNQPQMGSERPVIYPPYQMGVPNLKHSIFLMYLGVRPKKGKNR